MPSGCEWWIVAWLGRTYGQAIFGFFQHYYKPIFWTAVGLGVAGGMAALFFWIRYKRKKKHARGGERKAA